MLKLKTSKQAEKFLKSLPAKQAKQIAQKILTLAEHPDRIPSQDLKGYTPYRRMKSGEYRIIYFIEKSTLHITLVGKRNDDEIYKLVERFLK